MISTKTVFWFLAECYQCLIRRIDCVCVCVCNLPFYLCVKTLVEYAGRWKVEEDPLPLVEVYRVALLSYAEASPCLSTQCENVPLVLERLSL